jgi:hypothetical protein
MKLQRLFNMRPAEIAFRGRQEMYKAVERLSPPPRHAQPLCRFDRSACDTTLRAFLRDMDAQGNGTSAGEVQKLLQEKLAGRFFASLAEDWARNAPLTSSDGELSEEARALIARADAICAGEFDILGYGTLSYGQPVNWDLDPIAGKESPRIHWSRIDPLDPDQVGDSKVVWEVNRHQWVLDLGQAWRLTGDDRYAECFIALVTAWFDRNPYAQGINWSSALEAAMRSLSWCWALGLFRESAALTPERFLAILGGLQRHAGFIERYLSRYFAPNTHLTVEALALYTLGTLFPELQGAGRWRGVGRRVLLEQLPLHVPEGGVYFEQSTRYQYYTVEIYLHFAILASRNDDRLPDRVRESLAELLHFLVEVRRPDGTVPQIGDTDGGWLCPLLRREVGDYRGLFSAAAVFLDDAQLAWAADSFTHEAFCLLGNDAAGRWSRLEPQPPPLRNLSVHGAGDYVIMRSSWADDAHHLIFDTGSFGCPYSGAHGHADLLAIQCSAFGENYLVDPGTGCYTAGSKWREHFRSTRAHSTVRVDGQDQAETRGPFAWVERPPAQLLGTDDHAGLQYAAAQHEAYHRLKDPVRHLRRIWLVDSALWLIVDDLVGTTRHTIDLRFQFAPLPVHIEAHGWVRAQGAASSLLMKTFSSTEVRSDVVSGALSPPAGWYSPNYGHRVPAPVLTLEAETKLPVRFATLLIASKDPNPQPPAVEAIFAEGLLTGLSLEQPYPALPDIGKAPDALTVGAGL